MAFYKGVFWYNPCAEELITKKVACDLNGAEIEVVEYSSKFGENFNHKLEWEKLPKSITCANPYNYYPRGRVEIKNEKITFYLHLILNDERIVKRIINEFGLDNANIPIRIVADGSEHYNFLIDFSQNEVGEYTSTDVKLKIIICGGRHFNDYTLLKSIVDKQLIEHTILPSETEIVSGHCEGADMLGEQYAKEHGCALHIFPAEWTKYGKAAGPIRNKEMVDYIASADKSLVIAFVSNNTRGTKNTVAQAKKLNIHVVEISYSL